MLQLFCAGVFQVSRRGRHGIRRRWHLLPSHVRDGERFWTYSCQNIGLPNVGLGGGIVDEHFFRCDSLHERALFPAVSCSGVVRACLFVYSGWCRASDSGCGPLSVLRSTVRQLPADCGGSSESQDDVFPFRTGSKL